MPEEKKTKFCPNCGAEIDIKAKICPKCGVEQPIIPERISRLWWLVPLFLGAIGGLVAWLVNRERNPKTAKRLLIFGIVWAVLWIIISLLIPSFLVFLSSVKARMKAKDVKIVSTIHLIRVTAEIEYGEKDTYEFLSCGYEKIKPLCQNIEAAGSNLTIHATTDKYCLFAPMVATKDYYYCADSQGNSGYTERYPPCGSIDYRCKEVKRFR